MRNTFLLIPIIAFMLLFPACKEAASPDEKTQTEEASLSFPKKHLDPIERYGQLLIDVQTKRVFPDGKTFVDCVPKFPSDTILARYESQKTLPGFDLEVFVLNHFTLPEVPTSNFASDTSRTIVEHINALWPYLKREPDEKAPGSRISLPNPYIVPGGRFREVYYWDSYFILLGLKEAGETELIENILDNFAHQIDTLGFIPNGNRTYYLGRSQPPFFAEMVNLLSTVKDEKEVFSKYRPALEKEYEFWMKGSEGLSRGSAESRVVKMEDGSLLNRYYSNTRTPRAESYLEDITTAQEAEGRDPETVYLNISAACESGWDFSSRWFADPNDLTTVQTVNIIPVDLNALLYNLEKTLAKAHLLAGDTAGSTKMEEASVQRKKAIDQYLWDNRQGVYKDYDLGTKKYSETLSLAMVYPIYFQLASPQQAQKVAKTLKSSFLKPGGLVTTLNTNGQQWDSPNGWPPHQWMAVRGLESYGINDLAQSIEMRWLALNEQVYKRTGKMLEKYNVMDTTLVAGGGEYPTQDGFGWTNGVFLDLKNK